jgi:Tol biopolymer transport system component
VKVGFDLATGTVEGEPVPVVEGSRQMVGQDVSPDGDWLAFQSAVGSQQDIFVIRTDGTGRRQLTNDLFYDSIPRWSPDGERIVFSSNRSGSRDIWSIRADGSGLKQLTEIPDHSLAYPAWSTDGLRMSCWDFINQTSFIFEPNTPWQEQTPEPLPPINEDGDRFHAWSWSPDGLWLAGYVENPFGGDGIVIYHLESNNIGY